MNIEEELLKEHSKDHLLKIVKYIGNDHFRFEQLMYSFLRNRYRVSQRAAWVVSHCVQARPWLIKRWLEKIILNLQKDIHVAVKRNTVRVLQYIEIPEELQGIVTEICFGFLSSGNEPVAVKVFSMAVLANICKKHPELAQELKLSIEAQLPFASVAFHSRANKILQQLDSLLA